MSASTPQTLTSPAWLKLCIVAAAVLSAALAIAHILIDHSVVLGMRVILALFAGFCAVAAVDVLTTQVVLGEESLKVRRGFRTSSYSRASVVKASWEAGAAVSVLVEPQGWIRLPAVGPGPSVVRTIDAWIKRSNVD